MAIPCPRCKTKTTDGVGGIVCLRCGWSRDLRHRCPECNQVTRPSLQAAPGARWCPRCGWSSPGAETDEGRPYKHPRQALEMFLEGVWKVEAPGSATGDQLTKAEEGAVQVSRSDYMPSALSTLGNLVKPWTALVREDRLVLAMDVRLPARLENQRKCNRCRHAYGPVALRCQRCQNVYDLDDVCCNRCGEHRHLLVWPVATAGSSREGCPKCGNAGRKAWRPVGGKSIRIAELVGNYRTKRYEKDNGRVPEVSEDDRHGYCAECGAWEQAKMNKNGKWSRRRLCLCRPEPPRVRILWGLSVEMRQVRGLITGAMGRWAQQLKARELL